MGYDAMSAKDYRKARKIYKCVIGVTVYQSLRVDATIGILVARYKIEKKTLAWLNTCIKDINLPLCASPWQAFEVSLLSFKYYQMPI